MTGQGGFAALAERHDPALAAAERYDVAAVLAERPRARRAQQSLETAAQQWARRHAARSVEDLAALIESGVCCAVHDKLRRARASVAVSLESAAARARRDLRGRRVAKALLREVLLIEDAARAARYRARAG